MLCAVLLADIVVVGLERLDRNDGVQIVLDSDTVPVVLTDIDRQFLAPIVRDAV
jgi:hypothetical protein